MRALQGIYPPIPTPFTTDQQIAVAQLKANFARWTTTGLSGYVVLGSNGEYVALNEAEKLHMIRIARECIPSDQSLIAGTGAESTIETVSLSKRAANLGADAVIVVTPHYYRSRMDAASLLAHYRAVADACPVPVLLYNVPANTGIDMPADTVLQLAEHPNIAGIKDSSGNIANMAEVLRCKPATFQVLAGSAYFLLPALVLGASGGVVALANIAPEETVALYRRFLTGNLFEARALQLRLLPVNQAVTARWGVPALKAALDRRGYYGGPPRLPLLPLPEKERRELDGILDHAQLFAAQAA